MKTKLTMLVATLLSAFSANGGDLPANWICVNQYRVPGLASLEVMATAKSDWRSISVYNVSGSEASIEDIDTKSFSPSDTTMTYPDGKLQVAARGNTITIDVDHPRSGKIDSRVLSFLKMGIYGKIDTYSAKFQRRTSAFRHDEEYDMICAGVPERD